MKSEVDRVAHEACSFQSSLYEEDVTVAVVDSAYALASGWDNIDCIEEQEDLLEEFPGSDADPDPTQHGSQVANRLDEFSVDVSINLYRVFREPEDPDDLPTAYAGEIQEAIYLARERDEVDVVSLSLGNDHAKHSHSCRANSMPCSVRSEVEETVSDNIPVVAAIGNKQNSDSMCCPSFGRGVISAAAADPNCSAEGPTAGDCGDAKPQSAAWIDSPVTDSDIVLCTGNGCGFEMDGCQINRSLDEWPGNVECDVSRPTIAAPHRVIVNGDQGPHLLEGTSYSVPVVAGAVVEAIRILKHHGMPINASDFPRILRETGTQINTVKNEVSLLHVRNFLDRVVQTTSRSSFKPGPSI